MISNKTNKAMIHEVLEAFAQNGIVELKDGSSGKSVHKNG